MLNARRWLSLSFSFLILLIFAAPAAAASFSFRGVTWDSSPAQMMAAENLTEGDGSYNREQFNGYTFYYLGRQSENGGVVSYVFRGDTLVLAYTQLAAGGYAAELDRQSAALGSPADVSADTVSGLINAVMPGNTSPGDFSALTVWRLSDGTLAALFTISGESFMGYIDERRIGNGL